MYPWLFI